MKIAHKKFGIGELVEPIQPSVLTVMRVVSPYVLVGSFVQSSSVEESNDINQGCSILNTDTTSADVIGVVTGCDDALMSADGLRYYKKGQIVRVVGMSSYFVAGVGIVASDSLTDADLTEILPDEINVITDYVGNKKEYPNGFIYLKPENDVFPEGLSVVTLTTCHVLHKI